MNKKRFTFVKTDVVFTEVTIEDTEYTITLQFTEDELAKLSAGITEAFTKCCELEKADLTRENKALKSEVQNLLNNVLTAKADRDVYKNENKKLLDIVYNKYK